MYKKMVVLLDGSKLAEVVFDYAHELTGRLGLELELLHVCSPRDVDQLPMRQAYIDHKAAELCAETFGAGTALTREAVRHCVEAKGKVVVGYPPEEIIKYIDENDVDLIMMSTHGSSGVRVWDLGDVANKVVHASKVPVWLVPTELREEVLEDVLPKRPLVVTLSGSKQSEVALDHAVEIIGQRGAKSESELVLLHVVETPLPASYSSLIQDAIQEIEAEKAVKKEYLEELARPLRESGLAVRTEVLSGGISGDPAEAIIEYLKDNPSQLLVMATQGKSRLQKMVFGSVAETILHMMKVTPLLLIGTSR